MLAADKDGWRQITMKLTDYCLTCRETIPVGSQVMWLQHAGVRHLDCALPDGTREMSSDAQALIAEIRTRLDILEGLTT